MPASVDPNILEIRLPLYRLIEVPEIGLRHHNTNSRRAREIPRNHRAKTTSETAVRRVQRGPGSKMESEVLERAIAYTPAACSAWDGEWAGVGRDGGAVAAEAADGVPEWGGEKVG